jgi:hypothetical protein
MIENIKKIARMQGNLVINIESATQEWIDSQEDSTIFIEYTDTNPATIGGDYVDGYFYPIKPYESWNRDKGSWIAPIPYPEDNKYYNWSEEELSWKEIVVE